MGSASRGFRVAPVSSVVASNHVVGVSGPFPVPPSVSALLRGSCGARRLRSFCFASGTVPVLAPPCRSPRKAASGLGSRAHSLPGARDQRAEQEKRMYLNRITLIGFLGSDAESKASNATNVAVFSLATKASWKNDAGTWESRTEWHRCVAFGKLADFATNLAKGVHVLVEGELCCHEYQH